MSERQYLATGAWGQVIGADEPANQQLAELNLESKATPGRIEAARQLFPEASLNDFEAVGRTGRRLRHLESGREYMVAQEQVLMERDPRRSGVECFIVAGDRIWFLRARGWDGDVDIGVPGEILSGELRQGPNGSVQVVDGTGRVVRGGMRL